MDIDMRIVAVVVLIAIGCASYEDRRWIAWLRIAWSGTVGTWCAQRRVVGRFAQKPLARIRVPRPDEHSRGIMVARRDINTGVWT